MKPKIYWRHSFRNRMTTAAAQFYQHVLPNGWRARSAIQNPASPLLGGDAAALSKRPHNVETVAELVHLYVSSGAYLGLKESSKSSYNLYLETILKKFGASPLCAFDERGARTAIRQWRDSELAEQPRTADATIAILRLVLNFGVDEEYLYRNPAAGLGRIHTKTRRDIIWSDAQISTFLDKAPRHLARALLLAIWTGQRQADLLTLKWEAYDGRYIMLQPKKSYRGTAARRVKVLVSNELRQVLVEIKQEQVARSNHPDPKRRCPLPDHILTNSRGVAWTLGFVGAWRKAAAQAGLSGVTFHDLRGTFITLAHRAGASMTEIAEASGHDQKECERVIRRHYLAGGAEPVVMKLEAARQFTPRNWLKANVDNFDVKERVTGPRFPRMSTRFEKLSEMERAHLET